MTQTGHGPEPKLLDAADALGEAFPEASVHLHRDNDPTDVTVDHPNPPADFREQIERIAREKDVPHEFTGEGEARVYA